MNMAFKCIRLSLGVILFCIVNAETGDFPSLDCKVENLGQYGQQSLLQCVIKNAKSDTVIQIVSWKKASRTLLVFREGEIKHQEQGFSFAQPSWNNRTMNVSLLISNTAVEHQGEYTCYVLTDYGSGFEQTSLKVTAKYSKPKISSSQNTLTCESDGGYPEGQLRWYDEHNEELTSDAQTETKPVDGGLFQLSSKLIVEKKSPVSCRVFNASGGQEEETPFEEIDEPKTEGDFPSLDFKVENLGQYGQQSLLQCVMKYAKSDTVIQIVSWKKASRTLLVFREGEIKHQEQGFSFAQPSWNNRTMNVSLLISNTAVEHQGEYTCYVLTDCGSGFEKTSLKVTAKYSKPKISSSQNTLTCESDGGYPEGQLRWFDEHNVELTSDAQTETKPADGGLFQLSSKLIVEKKSPVSCRVFNASGGQEEETPFEEIDEPKTEGDFPSLDFKVENLGQYGQQSLLQCVMKYAKSDTVIQIVSWKKASRTLLVFREGEIKHQEQGFSFAQPPWNNRTMNVSLLISNTAVEHQGEYTCYVLTDYGSGFEKTSLKVTAKYSKPKISSSQNTLTCESDGGYPEGQLRWFDEHNVELTSDAQTETKPVDGGLFQLSSKLIVEKKSPVSCRVFNASGGQEEETPFEEIDEPKTEEQRKELDTATKIVAPVVVIGSLIAGLLLAMLIYKRRSQQSRRPSSTPLMGGLVAVRTSDEGRIEEGDDEYPDNVA